jgi:glycerol kinase
MCSGCRLSARVGETTALGAAYAAGLAVGFWRSTDELQRQLGCRQELDADALCAAHSTLYARWKKAVTSHL